MQNRHTYADRYKHTPDKCRYRNKHTNICTQTDARTHIHRYIHKHREPQKCRCIYADTDTHRHAQTVIDTLTHTGTHSLVTLPTNTNCTNIDNTEDTSTDNSCRIPNYYQHLKTYKTVSINNTTTKLFPSHYSRNVDLVYHQWIINFFLKKMESFRKMYPSL